MDVGDETATAARSPPDTLVFVDLETTGGSPAFDRIIEVGLVRFENGVEVEQWSTLIDPEMPIPPSIQSFTGISDEMVRHAPVFGQVASEVFERLSGAVFVAHNARFDHSFLHREFLRLDRRLAVPVLCTVKLSRRLYPEYARHNLDAVMERHGIVCHARHRALGDALVLRDLWLKLRVRWAPEVLADAAAKSMLDEVKLPPQLPPEMADELPDAPGVYRYLAADGALLFVGRSHALRQRILAQLGRAAAGSRDEVLAGEVRRVEWTQTAGQLGALLRETRLIRAARPRFNRQPFDCLDATTLRPLPGASGRVEPTNIEQLDARELTDCFGVFRSRKDARKALVELARAHQLCLKVLGVEDGEGSCVARQIGRCKGVCVGAESPLLHDVRVRTALSALKIKRWPFAGRIALRERTHDLTEWHVLDHWSYLGSARNEAELAALAATGAALNFDADVYKVLQRYFATADKLDWQAVAEPALSS